MAVGDEHVFPGFPKPVLTQVSFQSHRQLFSHASEERGERAPERKFAPTGCRTHNHQVMSQTCSPLSHPGGRVWYKYVFFRGLKHLDQMSEESPRLIKSHLHYFLMPDELKNGKGRVRAY